MEELKIFFESAKVWALGIAPDLIKAIVSLIVGFWLVKKVGKIIQLSLEKAKVSPEIGSFLSSLLDNGLKIVVVLVAAGFLGFQMSSLVAVLAAAGFAVGLALQGFLGNFASGITLVLFKPYKVGDWVEVSDKFGKVESIQIFSTTIITPGEKTLIIPNGQVTDGIITNFSTRGQIRLELQVTMPYAESFPKIKSIILEALKEVPYIMQNMETQIGIEQYDSHNIVVAVRPFINPDDYWEATFDAYSQIKQAFHQHNIQVAYSEGIELGTIGD